jgi:hypothetical protein
MRSMRTRSKPTSVAARLEIQLVRIGLAAQKKRNLLTNAIAMTIRKWKNLRNN